MRIGSALSAALLAALPPYIGDVGTHVITTLPACCRHDDAMAIILAGHSPGLTLLGVSTVAGNQTVEKVTANALSVLAAAGLQHIDVVAGASRPLLRPAPLLCAEIHGESGLDGPLGGPVLPPAPHAAVPGKAAVVMFERIAAAHLQLAAKGGEQRVQLIATAALTNVALLLTLFPEVIDMIEVSGGCCTYPLAELCLFGLQA